MIAASAAAVETVSVRAATQPDIVVVVLDDMRTSDWVALPKTQALLADGTWFPNFHTTTPLCGPSRATLLTGLYAHNHGVKNNYPGSKGERVFRENGNEARTVAKALSDAGYHTGLAGKYINGYDGGGAPPGWSAFEPMRGKVSYRVGGEYSTTRYLNGALNIIRTAPSDRPLFLWFAVNAPHNPATPDKPYKNSKVVSADPQKGKARKLDLKRLRTLLSVDDAVEAIAAAMGDRWDDAAVFVLSDNGFLLSEHGQSGKDAPWDGAVRIPMLARCPGRLQSGTDERLVGNLDIAPTIADLAGTSLPGEPDGRSLLRNWDRTAILTEGWWKNHARPKFVGVRTPTLSYMVTGQPHLFDWQADPKESHDLVKDPARKDDVAALAARLDRLKSCSGASCRSADSDPL